MNEKATNPDVSIKKSVATNREAIVVVVVVARDVDDDAYLVDFVAVDVSCVADNVAIIGVVGDDVAATIANDDNNGDNEDAILMPLPSRRPYSFFPLRKHHQRHTTAPPETN